MTSSVAATVVSGQEASLNAFASSPLYNAFSVRAMSTPSIAMRTSLQLKRVITQLATFRVTLNEVDGDWSKARDTEQLRGLMSSESFPDDLAALRQEVQETAKECCRRLPESALNELEQGNGIVVQLLSVKHISDATLKRYADVVAVQFRALQQEEGANEDRTDLLRSLLDLWLLGQLVERRRARCIRMPHATSIQPAVSSQKEPKPGEGTSWYERLLVHLESVPKADGPAAANNLHAKVLAVQREKLIMRMTEAINRKRNKKC